MVLIISKQTQIQFPVIRSGVYQNFSVLGSYYEIILHTPEQIYNIGSELHIFLKAVSATLIRTEFYNTSYYTCISYATEQVVKFLFTCRT
jgi:hypothetical protein